MHFHGAYFSNYDIWLKDPLHYFPSAHFVQPIIGQDILNSDLHSDFQGIHITSGIFQLWAASGLITSTQLKYATCASLIGTILTICGSYFHQHISWSTPTQYKKFKSLSIHHLSVLFGLSSISWAGHQIHISLPANQILDSGIDPVHIIPCPQDLFAASLHLMEIILPGSISQFFTILLHILFISSHVKFINRQHILRSSDSTSLPHRDCFYWCWCTPHINAKTWSTPYLQVQWPNGKYLLAQSTQY